MKTHFGISIILFFSLYFPLSGQEFIQEDTTESVESATQLNRNLWWITIGSGIGDSIDQLSAPSTYLAYSLNPAKAPGLLITVRSAYLTYGIGFGYFTMYSGGYDVGDLSVLVGAITKGRIAYASLSTGIGYTEALVEENDPAASSLEWVSTVGWTCELQAFITPASWFGLGLVGFTNLNAERPFLGASLCLQLGRLRL